MKAHRHSYKSVPPTSRSSANNSQEGNEVNCNGKVAIVVGGGSGIGRATAELFAAQGASVAVADVNKSGAAETAEMLRSSGAQVSEHVCDITRPEQVDLLVSEALEAHGRLDIVTSTVGWSDTTFFAQEDEAYWRKIVDINLMGSIFLCRSALRVFSEQKSGSIVLTSSDAGKVGTMGETVYAAAKAGVIGFVKSLAREIARDGIRINAISPGPTDTPLLRSQSDQHVIEKMIKAVPLKRMGTAAEQAGPIVFLASDAASYITGQTLSVSGGLTMTS
jgi:NAD(P)-dependent dehydrogenase (short-subunit alcohol dehydrogenase family)